MLDKLFFVKSSGASDPFRLMLVNVNWYLSFLKEVSDTLNLHAHHWATHMVWVVVRCQDPSQFH